MVDLDPENPVYLWLLALTWVSLLLVTVLLGMLGRKLAARPRQPLDAPAPLDTYGLACLAGGAPRLRETALAMAVLREVLPLTEANTAGRPTGDQITNRPAPGGPSWTFDAPPHPVEEAMSQLLDAGPMVSPGRIDISERLAAGYQPELDRLDLLAPAGGSLWLAPAGVGGVMLFALAIGSIIVAAKKKPDGGPPGVVDAVFVASAFALIASIAVAGSLLHVRRLNARGNRALAAAREQNAHLIPKGRHWSCLAPTDLALSIALFGLDGWAAYPPLNRLFDRLHPKEPADPGG
jgi:uncharacterized protein (TIGR04222 family)